jgi:hypothetical protein
MDYFYDVSNVMYQQTYVIIHFFQFDVNKQNGLFTFRGVRFGNRICTILRYVCTIPVQRNWMDIHGDFEHFISKSIII